jgi:hypothetical protein
MFTMKSSARRCSAGARNALGLGRWALAALALVVLDSFRCSGGSPDPLLASGEQALVGSYKLTRAA